MSKDKLYVKIVEMAKRLKEKESLDEAFNAGTHSSYGHQEGGGNVPSTSIMTTPNANIDNLDVPPSSELDDPDTLARVNMFVHQADGLCRDPWRLVKNIQYKLHIVGLNFKIPGTLELPTEETIYEYDLIKHGGDYGPLPDGTWKDDHGFARGFVIRFHITPSDGGKWELYAEVVKDDNADDFNHTDSEDSYS